MSHKLLLVDDEADTLEFLSYNLKKEGFQVFIAENGKEAIAIALQEKPHLILLDVMMPEMDGMETCEQLRNYKDLNNTVIAFLTARGEDYSQIAGFDVGADDYITKPIKPKVLISRIKALLKRVLTNTSTEKNEALALPNLVIDMERFMVIRNGEEIMLRRKEFELLMLLYSNPQKVFTREEIFSEVWGDDIVVGERTIDVHIRKLREKIGDSYIRTHKGFGYMFVGD